MNMNIAWYFDVVSPFAYLQWQRIRQLDVPIAYRPLLFAGLLDHFGHTGPAELPAKRLFTYRHAQWRADRAGVPMRFPPAHPFNPLPALRLCLAAGADRAAIDGVFDFIWRDGLAADTPEGIERLAGRLGIRDAAAALAAPAVKSALRANGELAIRDGVFGVPSLVLDSQVFWGEDATDMFLAYLRSPDMFDTEPMRQLSRIPMGATRKAARPASG